MTFFDKNLPTKGVGCTLNPRAETLKALPLIRQWIGSSLVEDVDLQNKLVQINIMQYHVTYLDRTILNEII